MPSTTRRRPVSCPASQGDCADHGMALTLVPITGGPSDVDPGHRGGRRRLGRLSTTADDDPVIDAIAATGLPAVIRGGPRREGLSFVAVDDRAAAEAVGRACRGRATQAVLSFPLDRDKSWSRGLRRRRRDRGHRSRRRDRGRSRRRNRRHHVRDRPDAATFGSPADVGSTSATPGPRPSSEWSQVRVAVCSINSAREAEALAAELLAGPDACDAIAAMGDELALAAPRTAARLGLAAPGASRHPGWDDADAAAPAGLTTVAQSLRDQGVRCAGIALGRLASARAD